MGYIFLDPSELDSLFYRSIYPKHHDKSREEVVPSFFQRSEEHKELREVVARRLRASEQYTQYLTENNLLDDDEEPEWQQLRERTAEAQIKLQELSKWNEQARDKVAQLEKERAEQCKQEQR